jgi:DNA anti-recombination protein RmuC
MSWFKPKTSVESSELKDLRAQVDKIVKQKREVTEELEELKLKKRLEQQEIAHLVKINEEKLKSELERKELKMEQDFQKKINDIEEKSMKKVIESLTGFHEKMEKKFNSELQNMKELMNTLVKVLPNVNMEMHIGDPTKVIEHKQ